MREIQGDLIQLALDGQFDVLIHGCNCQCVMGAGIAKGIKREFPEAYAADLKTIAGDRSKLGSFSSAKIRRGPNELIVVDAYTQFHWRGGGSKVDYPALARAFKSIKTIASGQRIGYPHIGAGLAGGDWSRIASMIDEELTGEDHVLVRLPG